MSRKPVSYLAGSVVVGTLVGAVVALLAAPRAGKDVRANLRARVKDLSRQVPQQIADLPRTSRDALKALPSRLRGRPAHEAPPEEP